MGGNESVSTTRADHRGVGCPHPANGASLRRRHDLPGSGLRPRLRADQSLLTPSIVRLLLRCSPSAVGWFVVAIHIAPVDAHAFGSFSHVSKESNERRAPLVADVNAAATVSSIVGAIRIEAACQHASPGLVGATLMQAVSGRSSTSGMPVIDVIASTTDGRSALQSICSSIPIVSAIAASMPTDAAMNAPGFIDDEQISKTLVDKVKLGRHLELILSGVMRAAVSAARPSFYFTSLDVTYA